MPTQDGPCCWLELCCPPEVAARALAEHLAEGELLAHDDPSNTEAGSYLDIARRLLDEFVLVPRVVEPVTPQGDPVPVHPKNERLEALLAHVKGELREVLREAGHSAGEEA